MTCSAVSGTARNLCFCLVHLVRNSTSNHPAIAEALSLIAGKLCQGAARGDNSAAVRRKHGQPNYVALQKVLRSSVRDSSEVQTIDLPVKEAI